MNELNNISKKLAVRIKNLREEQGFTQEDLSDKANIDYKHLQRLESTKINNDPKLSTLIKLSKALNIKISEILDSIL